MIENRMYSLDVAILRDGTTRHVIIDRDGELHAASAWLAYLGDLGRSPNTTRAYGARVAWYLSWTALASDWRAVNLSHIGLWRRVVANTAIVRPDGSTGYRSDKTIRLWMVAIRSLYEWADSEGIMRSDLVTRMTRMKYFAPGTRGGGEHGSTRRVLTDELRSTSDVDMPPQWIEDAGARERLAALPLNLRDRFLIDLICNTGIRAGEALSLFRSDMHFAEEARELGCHYVGPHFHIGTRNAVTNEARAKSGGRVLYVGNDLVERYIDYLIERETVLGKRDLSAHVFVNLYSDARRLGQAMRYSNLLKLVHRCGESIGYPLTGPHMFRHTLATRLLRGIDCEPQPLDVVQAILGHASIESTRVYTHDLETAKKAALASIAPRSISLEESSDAR